MSGHNQRNRRSLFSRRRVLMAGALASVTVLGACDGTNLFGGEQGSVNSGAPSIEITEPANGSSFPSSGQLRVRAEVSDRSGIKRVTIEGYAIRGDSTTSTSIVPRFVTQTIEFPQPPATRMPRDTTIIRFLNTVPGETRSEPVFIKVTAEDSTGATTSETTQILLGGPIVQLRSPSNNSQVQSGLAMTLAAFAYDPAGGIDSMQIVVTGAQADTFAWGGIASPDSATRSAELTVGAQSGALSVVAYAWNRNRVRGASPVAQATIVTVAANDTTRPLVSMTASSEKRLEILERYNVSVNALQSGASGLRRMGIVVQAIPSDPSVPQRTHYLGHTFDGPARTGAQTRDFSFTLADLGYTETSLPNLPLDVTFRIHAFGISGAGACGANSTGTLTALACEQVTSGGQTFGTVLGSNGYSWPVTAVAGFQVRDSRLTGNTVADLTLDAQRQRLFMSNFSQNRVEVLQLTDSTFTSAVSVGSQPWGMFINNTADRLIVANSGGTNISFVNIAGFSVPTREEQSERLLTPNLGLFEVTVQTTDVGTRYTVTRYDFSDRPQFIAQDSEGRLLYSTVPTGAAPEGTVRVVNNSSGRRETKLLYTRDAIVENENTTAIAHIDSIALNPTGTMLRLYDHVPGETTIIFSDLSGDLNAAIAALDSLGSDIASYAGTWDISRVGLSDTTYVAASGDRRFVAFGEGAAGPFADVWLWTADDSVVSDAISVADLVGNAAEQVFGVSLNQNGQLGAARGSQGAFFFSNNVENEGQLRLQGVFNSPLQSGSGGVALHPQHSEVKASGDNTLAFVAASDSTIKIVDTFHFRSRGEIAIKGTMVGPLRAGLPTASENAGVGFCDAIEVKLYGLMRTLEPNPAPGGAPIPQTRAVIINVRRKDIADTGCS